MTYKATCPDCQTVYNIPKEKIPANGARTKCKKCEGVIVIPAINDSLLEESIAVDKKSQTSPAINNTSTSVEPETSEPNASGKMVTLIKNTFIIVFALIIFSIFTSTIATPIIDGTASDEMIKTVSLATIILVIGIVIAGASNKVVVYYNFKDFMISFMSTGSMILAFVLVGVYQPEGNASYETLTKTQESILSLGFVAAFIFFAWSLILSIKYNRNIFIGLLIGVFKVFAALLGILVLVGQVGRIFDNKASYREAAVAMLIFAVFIWLGNKLINGEEVYFSKGWKYPKASLG